MKNSREIKSRIKSIEETSRITKAMHLVSIARMRKASGAFDGNRLYFDALKRAVAEVFAHGAEIKSPYVGKAVEGKTAYIVIASDKGLCGSFNQRILNFAWNDMKSEGEKYVFAIGQKAYDFFRARGFEVNAGYLDVMHHPNLDDARMIMYDVLELFNSGGASKVRLVYTNADKAGRNAPAAIDLLPVDDEALVKEYGLEKSDSYELSHFDEVVETVVRQFLLGAIYSALIQSQLAENYERMIAMENATTNSTKMLAKLNIYFNKLRQEKITTEISETSVLLINKD